MESVHSWTVKCFLVTSVKWLILCLIHVCHDKFCVTISEVIGIQAACLIPYQFSKD